MNSIVKSIKNKHVLVVGDAILDRTIIASLIGVSIETPTLKAKELKEEISFGGAGNVVNNVLALGAKCTFLTLLGEDKYLAHYKWYDENLIFVPIVDKRQNIVKNRFWIEKGKIRYKYLQINRGSKETMSNEKFEEFFKKFKDLIKSVDIIVFVDYNNGIFLNKENIILMIQEANRCGKFTIASSQISDSSNRYPNFFGVSLMCMNESEAVANFSSFSGSIKGVTELSKILGSSVCVTLGDKGSIINKSGNVTHSPAHLVEVVDSSGAGDSFLAALSVCFEEQDLKFCNLWASLSTKRTGPGCPSLEEINELVI